MSSRNASKSPQIRQFFRFTAGRENSFLSGPRLVLATDAILATLILIFPFIMGGREAWGHRVLISLSLALGSVWCVHQVLSGGRLRLLAIEPLILAGLLLVWFQTVPLTPGVLNTVSPEYARLLPDWGATQLTPDGLASSNSWRTASLVPTETRHALLMLLSYGIIAVVVGQRLNSEADCHRLLKLVGLSGILMAIFAVVQQAATNDRFFWFYRHPYTGTSEILKGAFTNRNHFAQFLALSIGPLIWWMLLQRKDDSIVPENRKGLGPARANHSPYDAIVNLPMLMMICAVGGVVVSIMLSLSRGGMMAGALATCVCLAGLWKSGRVGASLAVVIVGVGGIAIAGILVLGQGKIEDRIDQLASADADKIDQSNARRAIWTADANAIQAFPLLGCGVGSHRYVYPVYMKDFVDFRGVLFSHAESSWVHLATETGLVGLALVALGLLFVLTRILWHIVKRADADRVAALAAVLAGLSAGLFHSAVDFIWYVPAIVVTTIVLGVTGLRLCSGFRPEQGLPFPRVAWALAGVACFMVLCQTQPDLHRRIAGEHWWTNYICTSHDLDPARIAAAEAAYRMEIPGLDDPASDETPTRPTTDVASYDEPKAVHTPDDERQWLSARMNLLMKGLRADPQHVDTLQELSLLSLKTFQLQQRKSENPLSEVQIRDTAITNFQSTAEMHAWLKKAFGRNIKLLMLSDQLARRSLALCPVQGEAYMILLHTSFLRDVRDTSRPALISQTKLVGGNDPFVRYFIGDCLLTEGKVEDAIEQWRYVFHSSPEYRRRVCRNMARQVPVDFVITTFEPSVDELDEVLDAFRESGRTSDIEKLLYVMTQAARKFAASPADLRHDSDRMVALLMTGQQAAHQFGLREQCEEMLRLALQCDETSYWPHHAFGLLLLGQERYSEAGEVFEWCYEQDSSDTKVKELLTESRRLALRQQTRTHTVSHQETLP